ncbi:N-acetyl-gamma-glutamyl-phosphate reductase [Caldinitratiruptor microaerophilus]|uniref:N-acetyl-gamma-glutamyl-phosphate reductase n=1 Tax=Caldinitratiruptor microaerophilus TaxID=671077 RepID=A0AA35CMV8_9FIRM|nr:N-acetyl-gamma-glutamyl-phosphate reductase [Caldinitratiruptor microaerophilus]BDG61313.1 N-acetyl-gamma-glutamyl-phosphate reductase [Caldinitratiruptor microaerophilus]
MIRVGIAGATGYTGVELVRILSRHPQVRIVAGTSEQYQGSALGAVFPHLGEEAGALELLPLEAERLAAACDVVFLALPHGVAGSVAPALVAEGVKVIDLGADFRLRDPEAYRAWYRHDPAPAELLAEAAYGLPELYREAIRPARLVANPGCYPTSCALAAAPLLKAGLVETRGIVFDSKSGVSGAGRGVSLGVHFGEVNENFKAYSVAGTHRHTPEIEQTLSDLAGEAIRVTFTPHLVPMTRGILTTAYFQLKEPVSREAVLEVFRDFYRGAPFVRVRPAGNLPQTKEVWGSNRCDIGVEVDARTGRVLVVAVLDNLVKGAAGQAVQNMNLLFGLPETLGLEALPVYP